MIRYLPMIILSIGLTISAWQGAKPSPELWQARIAQADGQEGVVPPIPSVRIQGWLGVAGPGFGVGLLLVVIGALWERQQVRAEVHDAGRGAGQVDLLVSLGAIQAALVGLAAELAPLQQDDDAPALRARLDSLEADHIAPVVAARNQLAAKVGLVRFAVAFGAFSSGERQLHRCWSALTDGHAEAAREALAAAQSSFDQAESAWRQALNA